MPVFGYEGIYRVSDTGRVCRIAGWCDGRKIKIRGELRPDCSARGYPRVLLYCNAKRKRHAVHKLVYEAFNGPMPPGTEINHKNGVPADNRLENLEAVSHLENVRHSLEFLDKSSKMPRGERHWNCKLNEEIVRSMRARRLAGESFTTIAAAYGLDWTTAWEAITKRSWRHI